VQVESNDSLTCGKVPGHVGRNCQRYKLAFNYARFSSCDNVAARCKTLSNAEAYSGGAVCARTQ